MRHSGGCGSRNQSPMEGPLITCTVIACVGDGFFDRFCLGVRGQKARPPSARTPTPTQEKECLPMGTLIPGAHALREVLRPIAHALPNGLLRWE